MRLIGKNALITGGNKGIGKALAIGLAKEGCNIVFSYNSDHSAAEQTLKEICEYSVLVKYGRMDLAKSDSIQAFFLHAIKCLGKIDILINNAGALTRKDFCEVSKDELQLNFDVNFLGPFQLLQLVARYMVKECIKGSVINISSISDRIVTDGLSHYQCAKAAMSMLTKSSAYELAPFGIRVNTIAPGLTKTDINKEHWMKNSEYWQARVADIPLGIAGRAENFVGAALLLASDESCWMTGSCITIDGGRCLI